MNIKKQLIKTTFKQVKSNPVARKVLAATIKTSVITSGLLVSNLLYENGKKLSQSTQD